MQGLSLQHCSQGMGRALQGPASSFAEQLAVHKEPGMAAGPVHCTGQRWWEMTLVLPVAVGRPFSFLYLFRQQNEIPPQKVRAKHILIPQKRMALPLSSNKSDSSTIPIEPAPRSQQPWAQLHRAVVLQEGGMAAAARTGFWMSTVASTGPSTLSELCTSMLQASPWIGSLS